jgi:thiamine-monophosphate kinase
MKENQSKPARQPSELALLDEIRRRAARASGGGLRLGIGDDCALLAPRCGEELAVTTDLSIAGHHFRLDWHQPEAVGHRTLARGLSDLAAMGARPVAAFLSLGLPRMLTVATGRRRAWVKRFLDGLLALAETHKVPLAGGDLAESPVAVADIVLAGAVPRGRALLRSGAKPGDLLYVTGVLGGAAAGLARLGELAAEKIGIIGETGEEHPSGAKAHVDFVALTAVRAEALTYQSCPDAHGGSDKSISADCEAQPGQLNPPRIPKKLEALLAPHLYPQPRIAQGLWLQRRGLASAAIDLSDGLSTDLAHLCEESGVAAEVDAALLPVGLGANLAQALHGGEDYELLFTAPPTARLPRAIAGVPVTRIGRVTRARKGQPAVTLITEQGTEPLQPQGWEHFRD